MAVVEQQCVVGFAERTHFPVLVYIIPLLHILQDFVETGFLSFGFQFIVSALCTDFGRGSYEYLKFGIRKYGSADVATVHDNAFGFAHFLLLGHHCFAHKVEGGNGTDAGGYFHCADFLFHIDAVQVGVGTSRFRV